MISSTLLDFLSGSVTLGMVAVAVFFLRFWSRSRDPLFLAFSMAFALLGFVQAMLAFSSMAIEERSWLYLIRLLAFLIIIVAIVRKNRGPAR